MSIRRGDDAVVTVTCNHNHEPEPHRDHRAEVNESIRKKSRQDCTRTASSISTTELPGVCKDYNLFMCEYDGHLANNQISNSN